MKLSAARFFNNMIIILALHFINSNSRLAHITKTYLYKNQYGVQILLGSMPPQMYISVLTPEVTKYSDRVERASNIWNCSELAVLNLAWVKGKKLCIFLPSRYSVTAEEEVMIWCLRRKCWLPRFTRKHEGNSEESTNKNFNTCVRVSTFVLAIISAVHLGQTTA